MDLGPDNVVLLGVHLCFTGIKQCCFTSIHII